MILIKPEYISYKSLVSNVPEDEGPNWSLGVSYIVGDIVIYDGINNEHVGRVFECLIANSNHRPILGGDSTWLDCGYNNRWKMFDQVVGTQTELAEEIAISHPTNSINSIAFLDLDATEIVITMTDPVEGLVYSETIDLITQTNVVDAYTYFTEPIITQDSVVLLGVPSYPSAILSVSIKKPGSIAKIGTFAFGLQQEIGGTQYNPSVGITDYSRKEADAFGNYSIVERSYSKRIGCDLSIPNEMIDSVYRTLALYRATPVVWIGTSQNFSCMIVYGFYKSFSITIAYPTHSVCALEIEGLT